MILKYNDLNKSIYTYIYIILTILHCIKFEIQI